MGWRQNLITLISFTGQPGFLCPALRAYSAALTLAGLPALRIFVSKVFWLWEDVWLQFTLKADESHRSFQGARTSDLWGLPHSHCLKGYHGVAWGWEEPLVTQTSRAEATSAFAEWPLHYEHHVKAGSSQWDPVPATLLLSR